MNGDSFLLDTNTVLYLLNGDDTLALFLQDKNIVISIITEMELLSWSSLKDQGEIKKLKKVIEEFVIIGLENEIKDLAIALRRKQKIKLPDAIILATAQYLNIPLVTADKDLTNKSEATVIYYKTKV